MRPRVAVDRRGLHIIGARGRYHNGAPLGGIAGRDALVGDAFGATITVFGTITVR